MPPIRVPIRDILTDPDNPTDLTTLSQDQVIERLRELYSFLPSIEAISVVDDVAVISTVEESPYREEEALRTHKRASRVAERGNYSAAVEMFQEALEVLPFHAGIRRDLSMAYYELGDSQEAKRYIVQALGKEMAKFPSHRKPAGTKRVSGIAGNDSIADGRSKSLFANRWENSARTKNADQATWLSLRKRFDERTHHLQFPCDAAGFPPGGGPFPVLQLLSLQRLQCNDILKSLMVAQGLEFSRQSGREASGLVRCNDSLGGLAQRCLRLFPDWMM